MSTSPQGKNSHTSAEDGQESIPTSGALFCSKEGWASCSGVRVCYGYRGTLPRREEHQALWAFAELCRGLGAVPGAPTRCRPLPAVGRRVPSGQRCSDAPCAAPASRRFTPARAPFEQSLSGQTPKQVAPEALLPMSRPAFLHARLGEAGLESWGPSGFPGSNGRQNSAPDRVSRSHGGGTICSVLNKYSATDIHTLSKKTGDSKMYLENYYSN